MSSPILSTRSDDAPAFMRRGTVRCLNNRGFHRLRYVEWGDPGNPRVVVCVHGLTRNGRDFDVLGQALAEGWRVVCPDVAGRGLSDWLPDTCEYSFPRYVADMTTLIARLGVDEVAWVGTSMGGLIGMFIASLPETPVRRLILNDVGPLVTAASLTRIGQYLGQPAHFADLVQAEAFIRFIAAPFGPLTDAQWRHITVHSVHPVADGGLSFRYDPGIADIYKAAPLEHDVDLWPVYEQVRCPTLVIRGVESDLLTAETLKAMAERGPKAETAEVPGVGHAPMLMDDAQVALVQGFLDAG